MLASVAEFTAEGDTNILAMMEDSKSLNEPLTIRDGTFTLDLSGKSIEGGRDALLLTGSANVTLTNGSLSALTSGALGIRVQDGASLTVARQRHRGRRARCEGDRWDCHAARRKIPADPNGKPSRQSGRSARAGLPL